MQFAPALKEAAFRPCAAPAGKDARSFGRKLPAMTQEEFSRAFKGSPTTRARLRGLKRDAVVMLGNVAHPEDADVLTRALEDPEPLVRAHAAWALERIEDAAD